MLAVNVNYNNSTFSKFGCMKVGSSAMCSTLHCSLLYIVHDPGFPVCLCSSQVRQRLLWPAVCAGRLLPAMWLPQQSGPVPTWQLRSNHRPVSSLPPRLRRGELWQLRRRLLWRCRYCQKLPTWVDELKKKKAMLMLSAACRSLEGPLKLMFLSLSLGDGRKSPFVM